MDKDSRIYVGGVSGLIVRDGEVLLVLRGKEPYRNHWSLPGGGVVRGESLTDAVIREVREETGLQVEVGAIAGHREVFLDPDRFVVIAFHAKIIGGELSAGDDAVECEFVDPTTIGDRLTTPGLEDVLREAGLLGG